MTDTRPAQRCVGRLIPKPADIWYKSSNGPLVINRASVGSFGVN